VRSHLGRVVIGVPGSLVGVATMPETRRHIRSTWLAPYAGGGDTPRIVLVASAIRLSFLTIGWNLLAGVSTLAASVSSGSLSLGGFGLNTLIDTVASGALVWRFKKEATDEEAAERLERRAQTAIGLAMYAAALYLTAQGVHTLMVDAHPENSIVGLVIIGLSLILLPRLARTKARVASRLRSRALRGDAILTAASAGLALLTLAALVANTSLGWWWADAGAALVIAAALGTEASRAIWEGRRPRAASSPR
jgi:divalent metal cation (Fe/Co/Zn/Cd) transporter